MRVVLKNIYTNIEKDQLKIKHYKIYFYYKFKNIKNISNSQTIFFLSIKHKIIVLKNIIKNYFSELYF